MNPLVGQLRARPQGIPSVSIDKLRDVHSAVMRTAVDYGRFDANPLGKIRLKRRRLNRAKPFLGVDQFFLLVEALAEPYYSMVYVAAFTSLRVSQLMGLKWRNVGEGSISIGPRYARGDWDEPKSHASRATIPVDQHVLDRIHRLKTIEVVIQAGWAERRYPAVKSSGPDDLVFQSVKDGAPMRDNNVLSKHIKPAARALGFE